MNLDVELDIVFLAQDLWNAGDRLVARIAFLGVQPRDERAQESPRLLRAHNRRRAEEGSTGGGAHDHSATGRVGRTLWLGHRFLPRGHCGSSQIGDLRVD